ncbi:MAG: hypothetical protein WD468_03450, partial [Pirellulales bacterium]
FRCFTCGASGNQLDLWSAAQQLPLFEATIDLCHRLGIEADSCEMQSSDASVDAGPEKSGQRRGTP